MQGKIHAQRKLFNFVPSFISLKTQPLEFRAGTKSSQQLGSGCIGMHDTAILLDNR